VLEVLLALSVLMIGAMSAAMTTARCVQLERSTAEYVSAMNVCRDVVESLRRDALDDRFTELKGTPIFQVDDQEVEVRFPEALVVESLGQKPSDIMRYRDVDGDGEVDLNPAATASVGLLPVRVTVTQNLVEFTVETLVVQR
jgi:hypothetical protein